MTGLEPAPLVVAVRGSSRRAAPLAAGNILFPHPPAGRCLLR